MNACPTPNPPEPDEGEIAWPPERFYWAIVEPASSPAGPVGWTRDGPVPPGLLGDLADQVPLDPAELHAVAATDERGGGRVVICAAPHAELAAVHAGGAAERLRPLSLPSELGGRPGDDTTAPIDPARLNLLVGAFEPFPARRARARRHFRAAAAVLALAALVFVGLLRRAQHAEGLASRARNASAATLASLGFEGDPGPARVRLDAELDRLRTLAGVSVDRLRAPDAAAALARVLGCWPADTAAAVRSLSVGPEGASLSVLLSPPDDAAAFIASLRPVTGWTLDEPRLASVGSSTRITLRLRPLPAKEGRR